MAQQEPLKAISGNRGYKQELSVWDRAQISAYKTVGLSNKEIAGKIDCTRKTVASTLRLNALRDEGQTLPRSGRPPALSRVDRRNILRIVRSNPKITYAILKIEAGVTVHHNTVYKLLKEEGISN
jgi:transposase